MNIHVHVIRFSCDKAHILKSMSDDKNDLFTRLVHVHMQVPHQFLSNKQDSRYYCDFRLNMTPVFADYSLLVILIQKEITEMNLDIDRIVIYIFLNYV